MNLDPEHMDDETAGLIWWNGLPDRARELWLQRCNSVTPADAWEVLKRDPGVAFEIGVQVGKEQANAHSQIRKP